MLTYLKKKINNRKEAQTWILPFWFLSKDFLQNFFIIGYLSNKRKYYCWTESFPAGKIFLGDTGKLQSSTHSSIQWINLSSN